MKFNRIILDNQVSGKLSRLKGKTGLTPNILCRYGFILSLKDPTIPDINLYKQDGQELMRHVLFGNLDTILIALFKQRMHKDGFNLKDEKLMLDFLRGHLNRGVDLLYNKVKSLKDLANFINSK